jgi:polyhydroxyalkanoate synthesis regulator phasin
MEPKQIAKQMIDFSKTAFDNSFEAMAVLQDHTEKIVNAAIEQNTLFPEEGKKAVADWIKSYKKGRNDLKAAADENFKKVEAFFSGSY